MPVFIVCFLYSFIAFYMYFADVSPDEPLGETDCGGFNVFNVYSVAVQIEIHVYIYIYMPHLSSGTVLFTQG